MTGSKSRVRWIDIARGLGILLVVYAHAARGLVLANDLPATGWPIILDTIIYAFHMPLFFLLAGLHLERSVARGRKAFIVDKLQTIAWPYFLWSLVQGGLKLTVSPFTNHPITTADLIAIPVAPIEQFWFLYVLFFCQLFVALVLPRRWLLAILTLVATLVWVWSADGSIFFRILHYLPYVVVGLFAPPVLARLAERPRVQLGVALGVWLAFAFIIQPIPDPVQPAAIIYALALLGSIGTIAISMLLARAGPLLGWLEYLGRLSMPIFLMHTIFSAAMRAALEIAGLGDPAMMLVLVTAAGILLPVLAYRIAMAMNLTRLLGFGAPVMR
mgnify:CR=1 FL=1